MPIPEYDEATGALPPGEHKATLEEVKERYAYNHRRREIASGLEHVLGLLAARGVVQVWLDGSFVTSTLRPNDVDVIYVAPDGSDPTEWGWLSPYRRKDLKRHYRVDLWKYPSYQPHKKLPYKVITIKDLFESTADDTPKGIVSLTLAGAHD